MFKLINKEIDNKILELIYTEDVNYSSSELKLYRKALKEGVELVTTDVLIENFRAQKEHLDNEIKKVLSRNLPAQQEMNIMEAVEDKARMLEAVIKALEDYITI